MAKLEFQTLHFFKDENGISQLNQEQLALISVVFNNLCDGHTLHIMNPKDVLPEDVLDNYRKNNYDLNFNNVIINRNSLRLSGNYYWFLDQNKAFPDLYKKLKHDLEYISKEKNVENPSLYYAVIEEDNNKCHVVRGFVKGSLKEGFSIAVNPEYCQKKSKSVFTNALEFSDNFEEEHSLTLYQEKIDNCKNSISQIKDREFSK